MPRTEQQDFEHIKIIEGFPALRVRLGMIYPAGQSPKNAEGMIRLNHSPGKNNVVDKLYFPATGEDVVAVGGIAYTLPSSIIETSAPYGEILFNMRKGWKILFGRWGEEKPFTFNEGKFYLPLRFYRHEENEFNPVFVKAKRSSDSQVFYLVVNVCWAENEVALYCGMLDEEDENIPDHLREAECGPALCEPEL